MGRIDLDIFGQRIAIGGVDEKAVATLRRFFGAFEIGTKVGDAMADVVAVCADEFAGTEVGDLAVLHVVARKLATRFVVIHAATVRAKPGIIAIAGASGSGKTTVGFVADRLGFSMLGDDLALLEFATGRLVAVPKRPQVRPFTADLLAALPIPEPAPAADLPPVRATPPAPTMAEWLPLQRLIVLDDAVDSLAEALLRVTFGVTPRTLPAHMQKLLAGISRAEVRRESPLRWRLPGEYPAVIARVESFVDGFEKPPPPIWRVIDTAAGDAP